MKTAVPLLLLLVGPRAARAQSACQEEAPACATAASEGTQPCTFTTRRTIDEAANALLGAGGPSMPQVRVGCSGGAVSRGQVPCQILKAFAWATSSWRQFCTDGCDETGSTVIGWGCRHGMLQVPESEAGADIDLGRAASDLRYNAGAGARRLADAWGRTPCVGGQQPDVAEHWYFAVWATDAFTYANNPNNPAFPVRRPAYLSEDGSFDRGSYPFQEIVFGLAKNPPLEESEPVWPPSELSLPPTEGVCSTDGCVPADIAAPTTVHGRECPSFTPPTDGGVPDGGDPDGGDAGPPIDSGNVDVPTSTAGCDCRAAGAGDSSMLLWPAILALSGFRRRAA